jgi:hypothetical protein
MPPCNAAALLVEKNSQMPPCCERMAALLEEKNPQMPPCCCGGITGRKKSANAALLCTNGGINGKKTRNCHRRVLVAALLVENILQKPPCCICVQIAALLVEEKFATAALLL